MRTDTTPNWMIGQAHRLVADDADWRRRHKRQALGRATTAAAAAHCPWACAKPSFRPHSGVGRAAAAGAVARAGSRGPARRRRHRRQRGTHLHQTTVICQACFRELQIFGPAPQARHHSDFLMHGLLCFCAGMHTADTAVSAAGLPMLLSSPHRGRSPHLTLTTL